MINKILIETNASFSNVFITLNSFLKNKNTYFFYYNSFFGRIHNKLKHFKIISFLTPKVFKYSITTMPMYYTGLGKKNLLWIHDALTFEEKFIYGEEKKSLSDFNKSLIIHSEKSKYIITPSEFSKRKLIKYLNCKKEKIKVVPYQIDATEYYKIINDNLFLNKLRSKYILNKNDQHIILVGSPHFRKNLITALNVFQKLSKSFLNLKFLVVSYSRKDIPKTLESYNKIKKINNVVLLEKIPREDIIGLLNLSDLLLNPTLEEGFGLPNVEAQICKTPVVSSNISCIPEILGDSACLVDPLDEKMIFNACENILKDKKLKLDLVNKGNINIKKYTDMNKYSRLLEFFDE